MVNASVTPHYSFENTQLLLNGLDTVQPVLVTNGDKLRVLVCAPVQFGFNETFIMEYGHNADTITVVTEYSPPAPPPPDVSADSFVFNNASITVNPGVCSTIPTSESFRVTGLGNGVSVPAILTPDVGFDRAGLIVNNVSVDSPIIVRNGDTLRVLVCAPTVYGAVETLTLAYGGQSNIISVHTTSPGANVSGVATIEGYTVDSFGFNESAAFVEALAELFNIQAGDIQITPEHLLRRSLLTSHVGLDYGIAVVDASAGEKLKGEIKAMQPQDLITGLKAKGLNVSDASMTVVEAVIPLISALPVDQMSFNSNITMSPGTCATVPSLQAITVSGLAEGVDVEAELLPGLRSSIEVNGLNVASPVHVRNGDMIRVRVCVPLTFNFTETFSLTYGGQLDTFRASRNFRDPVPGDVASTGTILDEAEDDVASTCTLCGA